MTANGTEFSFAGAAKGPVTGDVLLVPLTSRPQPPLELVTRVDKLCDDAVSELLSVRAMRDEAGLLMHTTRGGSCRRILVVTLGDAQKLNALEIRRAAGSAARWIMAERLSSATLWLDGLTTSPVEHAAAEWASGMALAGFKFAEYKQEGDKSPARVRVDVRAGEPGHVDRVMPEIRDALTLAGAVNYARRLSHQPANVINPATLAEEARALVRGRRLRCTVLTAGELSKLGMNGLLAVGQGARHPACLIQIEYRGARTARTRSALVGKAITFDTGGYCIKQAGGFEELKFDKCGGAVVLGVLRAAADLKLKCNLVGLLAAAENAISEKAYRPGDIIRMMSGKTVEVSNTDAEGRLILADALWYAQDKLRPTVLVDVATLTSGIGVALGKAAAGLMSNDDGLAADLGEAGRRVHERLWRLPLWEDYRELIKSHEADIRNASGKRDAQAIVGGMFLKEFIQEGTPWAHIDIAGVATEDNPKGPNGKGATGFGVRLLVEFLRFRGA